jgi:hypothetical protein
MPTFSSALPRKEPIGQKEADPNPPEHNSPMATKAGPSVRPSPCLTHPCIFPAYASRGHVVTVFNSFAGQRRRPNHGEGQCMEISNVAAAEVSEDRELLNELR